MINFRHLVQFNTCIPQGTEIPRKFLIRVFFPSVLLPVVRSCFVLFAFSSRLEECLLDSIETAVIKKTQQLNQNLSSDRHKSPFKDCQQPRTKALCEKLVLIAFENPISACVFGKKKNQAPKKKKRLSNLKLTQIEQQRSFYK